ncbi:hypothetical protein LINPERHAP1_LOCUS25918 [Linum perenne]
MAEIIKAADRKEKKPLLDDGIGDEFLGSWKKMSVPVDASMDFNFEAVPKGITRHSTAATYICFPGTWISIWIEILTSYQTSMWTWQTFFVCSKFG